MDPVGCAVCIIIKKGLGKESCLDLDLGLVPRAQHLVRVLKYSESVLKENLSSQPLASLDSILYQNYRYNIATCTRTTCVTSVSVCSSCLLERRKKVCLNKMLHTTVYELITGVHKICHKLLFKGDFIYRCSVKANYCSNGKFSF